MKKLFAIFFALCMLFALTACGSSAADEAVPPETVEEDFAIPLGDTGAKVAIPGEMGFETYESELNDFYGGGPSGEWRVIVNTDPKSDFADYTLEDYATLAAQSNDGELAQDADGNYYFIYINEVSPEEIYKNYTTVREGEQDLYRVCFYCFEDLWEYYGESFADWATTVEVE